MGQFQKQHSDCAARQFVGAKYRKRSSTSQVGQGEKLKHAPAGLDCAAYNSEEGSNQRNTPIHWFKQHVKQSDQGDVEPCSDQPASNAEMEQPLVSNDRVRRRCAVVLDDQSLEASLAQYRRKKEEKVNESDYPRFLFGHDSSSAFC